MSRVYLVAVEPSGDALAANVMDMLQVIDPTVEIFAIGGAQTTARLGVPSPVSIAGLSILGLFEGLRAYPLVRKRVKQTVAHIMTTMPDCVVLVDSWGFMLRVAQGLGQAGFQGKIIKYVAPQVWAMREGRALTLARAVDHLMTIHSFDAPYFERYGLPVSYVGNPVFDTDYLSGNANTLREELCVSENDRVLAVLFGSRPSEIARLSGPFADAIARITARSPDLTVISPVSDAVKSQLGDIAENDSRLESVKWVDEDRKLDVFALADAALACSGTVTTQLASAGVPTVVGYRLHPATFAVAKHLFRPDYISIVNIAANAPLMPEFVQNACNGAALANAVWIYLNNHAERETAATALLKQTSRMRGSKDNSSRKAAETIIKVIKS